MDVIAQFSWLDLALLALLALGAFIGFTQGILRYVLGALAVLVAFVLAAQLRGPVSGIFGVWEAFPPQGRDLFFFLVLFVVLVAAFWLLIRVVYRRTRLPIARPIDEAGGAVLGVLFVLLVISMHLVVLDSFYVMTSADRTGFLGSYYTAMNDSLIIGFLRSSVVPAAGFIARPFVPREIAFLLMR